MKNKIALSFGVICFLVSCFQKNDKQNATEKNSYFLKNETIVFFNYGMLVPGYAMEMDSIATKKYGFTIKNVAGCEVTDQLLDSIKTNNQTCNLKMKAKYGKNWITNFENQTHLKLSIPNIE